MEPTTTTTTPARLRSVRPQPPLWKMAANLLVPHVAGAVVGFGIVVSAIAGLKALALAF